MDAITVKKSSSNGALYDLHGHVLWFHESHKLNDIMATVWENVRDFCEIIIEYSNEKLWLNIFMEKITRKCEVQKFWQ